MANIKTQPINCKICGIELNDFNSTYTGLLHYRTSKCKECKKEYERNRLKQRYLEEPELKKKRADQVTNADYKRNFGITLDEYNKKVELQLGGCAICKQPCETRKKLAVDHNHITNQVRDLLCYRCNTVLGRVNEDEILLFNMIEYLKRHNQKKAS